MREPLRSTRPDPAPAVPLSDRLALEVREVASWTGIPERRVREAVARGELPICRHGGGAERDRYVVLRADVERWLLSLRRPPVEGAS